MIARRIIYSRRKWETRAGEMTLEIARGTRRMIRRWPRRIVRRGYPPNVRFDKLSRLRISEPILLPRVADPTSGSRVRDERLSERYGDGCCS